MARTNKPRIDPDREYTTAQAAELLGLCADTIKQHCQAGRLGARKPGRDWLVPGHEIARYRAERRHRGRRPRNQETRS